MYNSENNVVLANDIVQRTAHNLEFNNLDNTYYKKVIQHILGNISNKQCFLKSL